jgi:tyrosine-protein phosphatase SIW14
MPTWGRWVLSAFVVLVALGVPAAYYRSQYTNTKRFREVTPGVLYRSGQFTASGLREIVKAHGIRSIVNLQEENNDPFMPEEWLTKPHIRESALCQELGVKYHTILSCGEILPAPDIAQGKRPSAIHQWLAIMDDPNNYPVLLHCKAGLHRTGRLTAIYRMEYEAWSHGRAMTELRANGYGNFMATTVDDYIVQYVEKYQPRKKPGGAE